MEFYDLSIWKKGFELLLKIYDITSKYPKEEKYNLISQTTSAGNSIIAQIVEACGRYSFADKVRVLYQSRGECFETISHLKVAFALGYIKENDYTYLFTEYSGLAKGINSYIQSLSRYKKI